VLALVLREFPASEADAADGDSPAETATSPGLVATAAPATSLGRLFVPAIRYENGYARHYDEQCSATIVSLVAAETSHLLLSAWHCLEDYRDLSRAIVFETTNGARYDVHLLASGGGMHSDWALLQLPVALPYPLTMGADAAARRATLAGFPHGEALVVGRECAITGRDGRDWRTDCVLLPGASGGAALSTAARPAYLGVISRGDRKTQSIFVPVERFIDHIRSHFSVTD
jgi:hypothetical protein